MKILLVTGFFPPYCPAATTRAPSLARFLLNQGHDVRVLCPKIPYFKPVLKPQIAAGRIHYVDLPNVDAPTKWVKGIRGKLHKSKGRVSGTPVQDSSGPYRREPSYLRRLFNQLYMEFLHFPDRQWPWVRPALKEGSRLLENWKPDIIYVSSPPYSQLFVARLLAKKYAIPWALEYRDTWVVQPYYNYSKLRKWVERRVEKKVTRSASSIFCVTQLAAKEISLALYRPILCARNGYDPEDFEGVERDRPLDAQKLTILYGGAIYDGKRDPSPLFEALKALDKAEERFSVALYTDQKESVERAVAALGVENMVRIKGAIKRDDFLKLECAADVLLLMRGPNTDEDSVIPGKLFEYIGAERPILALGSTTGEAVDIMRQEKLGLVSNDPADIAEQLEAWYSAKMTSDKAMTPGPGVKDTERFSRARQFAFIEDELEKITGQNSP